MPCGPTYFVRFNSRCSSGVNVVYIVTVEQQEPLWRIWLSHWPSSGRLLESESTLLHRWFPPSWICLSTNYWLVPTDEKLNIILSLLVCVYIQLKIEILVSILIFFLICNQTTTGNVYFW